MNPEDVMRELRDPDAWNTELRPRPKAFSASRRVPAFAIVGGAVALGALVGVLIVALVVPGMKPNLAPAVTTPTPTSTPTSMPTATPTATPTANPTSQPADLIPFAPTSLKTLPPQSAPKQPFNGNCSSVFSVAEVSALAGHTMKLLPQAPLIEQGGYQIELATRQAGGLYCSWLQVRTDGMFSSSDYQVLLAFLPTSAVGVLKTEVSCGSPTFESESCGIEQEANGIRASGGVGAPTAAKAKEFSAAVVSLFNTRANQRGSFVASPAPKAAWATPVDCTAIGAELLGLGRGNDFVPAVGKLLNSDGSLTCVWPDATAAVMGGGAWARTEVSKMSNAKRLVVDGVDDVYLVPVDDGDGGKGDFVVVFNGSNLLSFEVDEGKGRDAALIPIIRRTIAALDALKN